MGQALTAIRTNALNTIVSEEKETQKALENINKMVEGYEKKLASKTFETFIRAENKFQEVEEEIEDVFRPKEAKSRREQSQIDSKQDFENQNSKTTSKLMDKVLSK